MLFVCLKAETHRCSLNKERKRLQNSDQDKTRDLGPWEVSLGYDVLEQLSTCRILGKPLTFHGTVLSWLQWEDLTGWPQGLFSPKNSQIVWLRSSEEQVSVIASGPSICAHTCTDTPTDDSEHSWWPLLALTSVLFKQRLYQTVTWQGLWKWWLFWCLPVGWLPSFQREHWTSG